MNDMDYRGFEIIEADQPIWNDGSDRGDHEARKPGGSELLSRNGHGPQYGLRSIIDSSAVPNEKLPMLDVDYDRLVDRKRVGEGKRVHYRVAIVGRRTIK